MWGDAVTGQDCAVSGFRAARHLLSRPQSEGVRARSTGASLEPGVAHPRAQERGRAPAAHAELGTAQPGQATSPARALPPALGGGKSGFVVKSGF